MIVIGNNRDDTMIILDSCNSEGLRAIVMDNEYVGCFYVLECGDDCVKIGRTTNPFQRIRNLQKTLGDYGQLSIGRVAISRQHTNYIKNETKLHKLMQGKFENRVEGTELFLIPFDDAIEYIRNCDIVFEDKSKEKERASAALFESVKNFAIHGVDGLKHQLGVVEPDCLLSNSYNCNVSEASTTSGASVPNAAAQEALSILNFALGPGWTLADSGAAESDVGNAATIHYLTR